MSSSQVPHLPSGTGVEHFRVGKDGSPEWYVPTPTKTRYDFPKAKEGESDRLEFAVGQRHPGKPRRLDRYLQERFPGYSRSFLQKMIKEERVLLNGKTTQKAYYAAPSIAKRRLAALAFMAAMLNSELSSSEAIAKYLAECRPMVTIGATGE